MARPRRFGKSLLISTLFHLFQGDRELFEGLWVERETHWDWSQKHPIIHLDMLNIANKNPHDLEQDLKERIATLSEKYNVFFNPSSTLPACLNRLIEQLAQHKGPPVVLVDEYDRPMVNHLGGDTDEQLAKNLKTDRARVLEKVRHWYDGYRFSSKPVNMYNPFSTLLLLKHREFHSHWFATGTPSFLTHLMKRNPEMQPEDLVGASVSESAFTSYALNKLHECLLPLMVQTGYLSITDYNAERRSYTVDYPNREVREAFLESLMEHYIHVPQGKTTTALQQLVSALEQNDLEVFFTSLRSILAGIPYRLHIPLESYYQTIFYVIHQLLGYSVHTEVCTHVGRIDAVIDLPDHTYVFEFKLHPGRVVLSSTMQNPDAVDDLKDPVAQEERAAALADTHKDLANKALQQIKDKHYAEKYLGKNKSVTLVGAVFTVNTMQGKSVRQVTAWVQEKADVHIQKKLSKGF